MRVTVFCFGATREHLPPDADGNRAEIEVPEGASVVDLAGRLGMREDLLHAVLVDGVQAERTSVLHEGAEVTLMPPFAGGT